MQTVSKNAEDAIFTANTRMRIIADVMTQAFDPLLRQNVFIRFLLSVCVFLELREALKGHEGPSMLVFRQLRCPFYSTIFRPSVP